MKYDPEKHHRRSIRLKGYDYSQPGAYFVTIVTQNRECLFGDIVNGRMRLNDAGRMVERWWLELNHKFPTVRTGVYVVMPNHFHGIITIGGTDEYVRADLRVRPDADAYDAGDTPPRGTHVRADPRVRPDRDTPPRGTHTGVPLPNGDANRRTHAGDTSVRADLRVRPGVPLPTVVQWFKTMTTNEYIRGVKTLGWTPFPRRLWQRNYYEHIIRNDREWDRIRAYIANNPVRWERDRENPSGDPRSEAPWDT